MKKSIVYIILALVLVLLLTGCGVGTSTNDNGLLDDVTPETSGLGFFVYDGEKTTRRYMFDEDLQREIIKEMRSIKAVKAKNWSTADVKTPIYGIEHGWSNVGSFGAAWSNGYWITQTGEVYEFDYDFKSLLEYEDWGVEDTFNGINVMPCSRFLAQHGDAWNKDNMTKATKLQPPKGIEMKLISWKESGVTVEITNNNDETWEYGRAYYFHVLLDNEWYVVPSVEDIAVNADAIALYPGETHRNTYDFYGYGTLPNGVYRLVVENLSVRSDGKEDSDNSETEVVETWDPDNLREVEAPNADDHPWETGPTDDDLVNVLEYIPTACADIKYATEDNFVGQKLYDHWYPILRYGTVRKLMEAEKRLNELGYRIKIWDAYRPVSAQEKLWEICPDPRYVSNPATGYLGHSRGNTIDLTIVDYDTLEEIEMPTGFDDFTAKADRDYSDVSKKAAENSALLEMVMTECGFTGYSGEWWHYSDTTEYPVIK